MKPLKVGDKIRLVGTKDITGVITSKPFVSKVDGGGRIKIKWDVTGNENVWDFRFLRPAKSDPFNDPEGVVSGTVARVYRQWVHLMAPELMMKMKVTDSICPKCRTKKCEIMREWSRLQTEGGGTSGRWIQAAQKHFGVANPISLPRGRKKSV